MRLTGRLRNNIEYCLTQSFPENSEMLLFGSRADDSKKGGDFDIAVKTDMPADEFKKRKIKFFTELMKMNLVLKIDLVQYKDGMDELLKSEIQRDGIKLNAH